MYEKNIPCNLPQWHIPIELHRRLPNHQLFGDQAILRKKRIESIEQAMDLIALSNP